jgi:DNA-binding phage protein
VSKFLYEFSIAFALPVLYKYLDMQMELDEFGPYLRSLAEKETAVALAKRLGVSRATLYTLMDGAMPSSVVKVCRVLDVKLSVPGTKLETKGRGL